jgi:hypothetical protein
MNAYASFTDAEIRELAREILARTEYAQWRPEAPYRLAELLDAAVRWLRHFYGDMLQLAIDRPLLYAAIVTGMLLVSVLLLIHIAYSLRAALSMHHDESPQLVSKKEPPFAEQAETLARNGCFLEATHRLQLAVIALLLRRRVIQLSRSDPNRTLRLRLRDAKLPTAEREEMVTLLDRFEFSWFRDRDEDPGLYESWRRLLQRLEAEPERA